MPSGRAAERRPRFVHGGRARAESEGFELYALTVRYGQRHARELEAARARGARRSASTRHLELAVDLRGIGGSSLTSDSAGAARSRSDGDRHSVDLRAGAQHDLPVAGARRGPRCSRRRDIVIGVNALDYSGYPDCRPEFIARVRDAGVAGDARRRRGRALPHPRAAHRADKAEIIRRGLALGLDYGLTHSCYDPGAGRAAVRPLRQLRAAGEGVCRGGRGRPVCSCAKIDQIPCDF